jgi:carbon-monoxide dehydrogenase small subunit
METGMKNQISFILNGSQTSVVVDAHSRLIDILRGPLGLTGTKEGCGEGECGACTVILNGRAINSCLYPAFELEGKEILTIEGLHQSPNRLSAIQQAFVDQGAIQCGFCSPGMILSAKALLDFHPDPSEEQIREALLGNLCRCTGYLQILEAVKQAAQNIKEVRKGG